MRRLAAIGFLSLLVVSSCTSSSRSGSARVTTSSSSTTTTPANRAVNVRFAYGPPRWPWTPDRSPTKGSFLVHGRSQYTGDWTATATYASAQQSVGARSGGFSLGVLDGKVTGCGSGQFLFMDAFASTSSTGGWLIVPGFGTHDLTALNGSGTWQTAGKPAGAVGAGIISGPVTCTGEGVTPKGSWFYGTSNAGSVKVQATASSPMPTISWQANTSPPGNSVARPIIRSDGFVSLRLTGTWRGDAVANLATATKPSADGGFAQAMVMRFTGTAAGCGTGSFLVTVLDRTQHRDADGVRSWEIIPGLGTGDLANARGFGTGTVSPDARTATFQGLMACHT